jgi:hypothetical protein
LAFGLLATSLGTPAQAQGLFESLFGGIGRSIRAPAPETTGSYADPHSDTIRESAPATERRSGGGQAFCVRTCDGHYFPVHAQGGASAAQICKSFCPASETRIYSGSAIDHAAATDGSPYLDLPNAYAYRQKLVSGCTCNGKSAFGLARIDVATDPTLRKGDVVATTHGLTVFSAKNNEKNKGEGEFTPISDASSVPKTTRERLSNTRIMPPTPAANTTPVTIPTGKQATRD